MIIQDSTATKYLKKYNFQTTYKNILALKDECGSDYDREDYGSLDDLMDDAIMGLSELGKLEK